MQSWCGRDRGTRANRPGNEHLASTTQLCLRLDSCPKAADAFVALVACPLEKGTTRGDTVSLEGTPLTHSSAGFSP
eukprot:3209200-Amphidinium_carterae.1